MIPIKHQEIGSSECKSNLLYLCCTTFIKIGLRETGSPINIGDRDRIRTCDRLLRRQALNPIIGIDPRVEVLNLDPAEKGGISSTYNFQCVLLTSQN